MSRPGQWCTAVLLATAATQLYGAGAHVDSKATLHVAIRGGTLPHDFANSLHSPVGFEGGLRNHKQRGSVPRMAGRLHHANEVIVPSAEGLGAKTAVKLESPVIFPAPTGIEILLFDAFPHLKRVDARIADPGKQLSAVLTGRKRRV